MQSNIIHVLVLTEVKLSNINDFSMCNNEFDFTLAEKGPNEAFHIMIISAKQFIEIEKTANWVNEGISAIIK